MRYVKPVFRPPSEAASYLLQATIGCSWNHCTYCPMYRDKQYEVRPLDETPGDIAAAGELFGDQVRKVLPAELARLRELGLKLIYIGPASGDDATLKRIANGATAAGRGEPGPRGGAEAVADLPARCRRCGAQRRARDRRSGSSWRAMAEAQRPVSGQSPLALWR